MIRSLFFFSITFFFLISCNTSHTQVRTVNGVTIIDTVHFSKIFNENRYYRVFLPPDYHILKEKRYPVIYYFHGYAGRFNGPAEGVQSESAESRYYDEFNGNISRCGPDSLDNFAEYVRTHDVIIAKWDGYVASQYPRPYDVGPVKDDLQFVDYFPEFINVIDENFRTIADRKGRAVSGLSMGGFMSLFVASKYPHLIGSASFFNPAVGFIIGPRDLQIYTPFDEMGRNYVGLPIRMHIGNRDFLRQHNLEAFNKFKKQELFFESWHYGINYFQGYHYVVNVEGQFDFHLKQFRMPAPQPSFWYHIDVYPDFEVWDYRFESDRKVPGYTVIDEAGRHGMKISTKKWLPDGQPAPETSITVTTDAIYQPNARYHIAVLDLKDRQIRVEESESDTDGKIQFQVPGSGSDIGIYKEGDPGFISVADYEIENTFPTAWQSITVKPVLFNKGGNKVNSIDIEAVSLDEDLEVLSGTMQAGPVEAGDLYNQISFLIRARAIDLDRGLVKLILRYEDREDSFLLEIPFYSSEKTLDHFQVADGKTFRMDRGDEIKFGTGNGNGVAEPGESVALLTQSDLRDDCWYGMKLYTDDPNVPEDKEELVWTFRDTYIGNMRPVSVVHISRDCPRGHIISFQGKYDFQKKGNPAGNNQAAHSFIHETHRVILHLKIGE